MHALFTMQTIRILILCVKTHKIDQRQYNHFASLSILLERTQTMTSTNLFSVIFNSNLIFNAMHARHTYYEYGFKVMLNGRTIIADNHCRMPMRQSDDSVDYFEIGQTNNSDTI